MTSLCSWPRKIAVAALATIAVGVFASAICANLYWSGNRRVPVPALGQVVERSDHGHKYYLTATEDRFTSEYIFAGAIAVLGVAYFLNQRWSAFKT